MKLDLNIINVDEKILDPKIKALIKHYDFNFVVDDLKKYKYHAVGIGDILNAFTYLKKDIMQGPIVFPLFMFFGTHYYPDPLNALKFILRLIYDLIKSNSLSMNKFLIVIPTNSKKYIDQFLIKPPNVSWIYHCGNTYMPKYNIHVNSFTLDLAGIDKKYIPTQLLGKKYIIFNTKLRFDQTFNYTKFKQNISTFFKTYKTNYTIVLLGERVIGGTKESIVHKIQTMYTELLELKNNNDVIDLTTETITNNLDYDLYIKDISIMHYAEYSICSGLGGHFCSSLAFAKNIITFESTYETNLNNVENLNLYKDFNEYTSKLKTINMSDKIIIDPKIKALIKHYDFNFVVDDLNKYKYHAIGIGDILNVFTYLKKGVMLGPIVFPIFILFGTHYYPDPLNALEFRLRLIYDLLKSNSLSMNQFLIVIPTNSKEYVDDLLIKPPNVSWMYHFGNTYVPTYNIHVKSFTLDLAGINKKYIPIKVLNKPYIVFNTKLRFNAKFNYAEFKQNMSTFFKTYKTNYIIILLGEENVGRTREVASHNMQTMYTELLELKNNNDVIDLTTKTITNNLDYDLYVKDASIMHYAEYSICSGLGGHFCSSLAFAKNIITFEPTFKTNFDNVENLNFYKDFNDYLLKLKTITFS